MQSVLNLKDRAVYRVNEAIRNEIDIVIVTDGEHHVLDLLHPSFKATYTHQPAPIEDPLFLGFEAHKVLEDNLKGSYDYLCYLEDDIS